MPFKYHHSLREEAQRLYDGSRTHKEIAQILGVSQATVNAWVNPRVAARNHARSVRRHKEKPSSLAPDITARRTQSLALRRAGLSFREISEITGVHETTALFDVSVAALDEAHALAKLPVKQHPPSIKSNAERFAAYRARRQPSHEGAQS